MSLFGVQVDAEADAPQEVEVADETTEETNVEVAEPEAPVVHKYKVSVREPDCCEADWVLPDDAAEYGLNLITTDHPEGVRRLHAEDCSSR